ncbi:hypothetical protein HOT69_gp095 [Cyanophage S-TIM4]|uniref:Uncharacterized protein n=2 Tax=Thaumasvirus stim4 TaxID=2734148 RepID=A0A345AWM5_9CAUD|nr:hypothetical protein PRSM4_179 [Prochlorococcus phage P-RSM4]YP_009806429.1 hypothetical protein HOT69_gp095 [Cyanophage S-TIM4]ADO98562.1 hypothetical protein PRSM4_179 [Prochlorococcus phage P-RSM4]AXF41308.1 unknown [Cyanophage S-TIM4]|tara:strand:- start:508 stop:891 length:384 start_codon:yes stop_codon:yes gene_type:complete
MSVRIVRTRNGEDVICDLYEVTTKEDPSKAVAFQLNNPYIVWLQGKKTEEPKILVEDDAGDIVSKIKDPDIYFQPWIPLSSNKQILLKLEEVVTAYETYPEVITKYNTLIEADGGKPNQTPVDESTE